MSFPGPSSLQEFVKDAGSYSKRMVDELLDQITGGDHSRVLLQLRQVGCAVTTPVQGPSTRRGSAAGGGMVFGGIASTCSLIFQCVFLLPASLVSKRHFRKSSGHWRLSNSLCAHTDLSAVIFLCPEDFPVVFLLVGIR